MKCKKCDGYLEPETMFEKECKCSYPETETYKGSFDYKTMFD